MIAGIVLAAGFGTRFGGSKALVSVDGEPALARLVRRLRAAGISRPIVILGEDRATVEAQVDLSECRVVVNPDPSRGLSSSVRLGLASVETDAAGALFVPVDMPAITVETIRAVGDAAGTGARIAAPFYRGRRGFPVYFERTCFDALSSVLVGDRGARGYIDAHPSDLTPVEVDDPGCLLDVDTPEDLDALNRLARSVPCDTSA